MEHAAVSTSAQGQVITIIPTTTAENQPSQPFAAIAPLPTTPILASKTTAYRHRSMSSRNIHCNTGIVVVYMPRQNNVERTVISQIRVLRLPAYVTLHWHP